MSARQHQASNPEASVWVAASAGTGKTKVLTDRVLRLLLANTPPQRILCLTFTKAAAAEMANRLHGALGDWAGEDDDDLKKDLVELMGRAPEDGEIERARQLFARVLDAPGGLKIQTIHAFCQSLLGRFPLEAGVAPHFRVADERGAAEMLEAAQDRVLKRAQDAPASALGRAVETIAAAVEERGFRELMGELARERARLDRLFTERGGLEGVLPALRRRLGLAEGEDRAAALAAAAEEAAFDGAGLRAAAEAMTRGGKTDQVHGALIADWLSADAAGRAVGFDLYLTAFFTEEGSGSRRARLVHKEALTLEPGAEETLAREAERLVGVRNRLRAIAVADSTTALLSLAGAILETYGEEKRRHGVLDYDDLILGARDLLHQEGTASWVLYKLDGGLDHILIDEGQDTNPEQWDIVAALTEEFFAGEGASEEWRTIFAVGDAKQSIYSFQRADPYAFARMREQFAARVTRAERPWLPIELVESYRSTASVLGVIDAVFKDPEARKGLLAETIEHVPLRRGQAGLVELWPTERPVERPVERPAERPAEADDEAPWPLPLTQHASDSPSSRLAARIADRIGAWRRDAEILPSRGDPIRAGDIMILVQRRSAFVEEMVRALKERDIPVAGIDRMVLTDQLAVMDLMALGRFVLLPEDDLTLAVVLKGPLVGLDEKGLFDLAHGRGDRALWQVLAARRRESEVVARAHAYLSALLGRADYVPPFEFYADVLGRLGGRERLVARLGHEANDPIDEFLSLALAYERDHAPSLQGFLHWLEAGKAEVKRDLEQGRDEVRVMTVHGAKGLQAPIVFLPDTCRVPYHDESLLWLGDDGTGEMLLWPVRRRDEDDVSERARKALLQRGVEEYHRLLYVAMTRAADRLYIGGWQTQRARGAGCWYDLIAAAMAEVGEEEALEAGGHGWRCANPQEADPEPTDEAPPAAEPPAGLPDWATGPPAREALPPRPLAPSRPEGEEPAVRSPLGADEGAAFRRGRLIHRLLELLPGLPPEARAEPARRFLARPVHGLAVEDQTAIAVETMGVLEDERFAHIFGPQSRAEVPIAGMVSGRVVAGQIDRLLVGDSEVLVVDYKSNRPPPSAEEDVAETYLRQMAAYRALLRLIYPGKAVRCALLWTDGPRLMALGDALLDRTAPSRDPR